MFSANEKIEVLGKRLGIPNAKAAPLLFSIHTYFAIFMKILAAEICQSLSPLPLSIVKKLVGAPSSSFFRSELRNLEDGGIWSKAGITNFLEGDIFSWYLEEWSPEMFGVLKALVVKLDDFDPYTLSVDPDESQDLLKNLYEDLVPGPVRHDLGEYYTPDWLVDLTLREAGYTGQPDSRMLDPSCGSGSFLIAAINRVRQWFFTNRFTCGFGESVLLDKILTSVKGFDLNPLAVMASRVNYLLALKDLLKHAATIEIPVFLCDTIQTPAEHGTLFTGALGTSKTLKTAVGPLVIPAEAATSPDVLGRYTAALEQSIRHDFTPRQFVKRIKNDGLSVHNPALHEQLFTSLQDLGKSGMERSFLPPP